MADDTKAAAVKAADSKEAAPEQEKDTTAVPTTAETESVRAIVLHPIYTQPGMPPIRPGATVTVCVVTARNWLAAGLIRLEDGEALPPLARGETDAYPVFTPSGQPAPASQV